MDVTINQGGFQKIFDKEEKKEEKRYSIIKVQFMLYKMEKL